MIATSSSYSSKKDDVKRPRSKRHYARRQAIIYGTGADPISTKFTQNGFQSKWYCKFLPKDMVSFISNVMENLQEPESGRNFLYFLKKIIFD